MKGLLITTVKAAIDAEFGLGAFAALTDPLEQLVDRLAKQAVEAHVAVLDDPIQMAVSGLRPLVSTSTAATVPAVRALAKTRECDAVLLVGGHSVLPMVELPNPVGNRALDVDAVVRTDVPYGADGDTHWECANCPRIVSRIPSPRSKRLADFIAIIDAVATAPPSKSGGTAIVSQEWGAEGARVAARMPGPVLFRVAPHYELDERHRSDLSRRWLYVNLHGRQDHDRWQTFDGSRRDYVTVMDPASFGCPEVTGSSLYCENCYGFKPLADPTGATCIDTAFRSGLRSVIAATGLAYGAYVTRPPFLQNADFLASAFFDGVRDTLGAGDALREARKRFLERIRHRGFGTNYGLKTLLQFQLLGDPTV